MYYNNAMLDDLSVKEVIEIIQNENGWFVELEDFKEACNDKHLEVPVLNREYAVVYRNDEDEEYIVRFGGTERTIIIASVEEAM